MSLYLALVVVFPFVKIKGRTDLVVKTKKILICVSYSTKKTLFIL